MFDIDDTILGSVVGSVVSGLFSNSAASSNRNFQAQQSGTQYQRAVMDLKAAGLNPMLAYAQGGNSAASGAMAQTPQFGDLGVSSAATNRVQKEQERLVREQSETQVATQMDLRASAQLKEAQAQLAKTQTTAASQGIDKGQLDIEQLAAGRPHWSANALFEMRQKGIGVAKIAADVDKTIQDIQTGNASEDQIRAMIKKINLELPGLKNMAEFEKSLAGEPTAAGKALLPILQFIKSLGGK